MRAEARLQAVTRDVTIRGALCDGDGDCDELCIRESTGTLEAIWGRLGHCQALATGEPVAKNSDASE
jgi:hypothetical protein